MDVLPELLGRHGGFILVSYIATVGIMGGIIWRSVRRYAAVRRRYDASGADRG